MRAQKIRLDSDTSQPAEHIRYDTLTNDQVKRGLDYF